MADTALRLRVVIPCFNEEAVLPLLDERPAGALDRLGVPWEIVSSTAGRTTACGGKVERRIPGSADTILILRVRPDKPPGS